jgi:hypothetical protein
MSTAAKMRIAGFLISVGVCLLFAGTANAQDCCGSGCSPPPPPPSPTCVLTNPSIGGLPVPAACPSTVNVSVVWGSVVDSTLGCNFTCVMNTHDSAYATPGQCVTVIFPTGTPPENETSTLKTTFNAFDHNFHYVGILTTVVDSNGIRTTYNSPTIGTKCST